MESGTSFEAINDAAVSGLIRSANRRVLLVIPAVSREVAKAVEERWQTLGSDAVTVITDLSEVPYRLGFGELEGLKVLTDAARRLQADIQTQEGVRLGLVIADETILLFSPTALAIEDHRTGRAANGFRFDSRNPAVGLDVERASSEIGLQKADEVLIRRVTKRLEQNPPKQFDVTRTELVFSSEIEFVELELKGVEVQKKTASLPPDLLRLIPDEGSRSLLNATFHLLDKADLADGFGKIREEKRRIADRYLEVLPKYGTVIRRRQKEEFTKAVDTLKATITSFSQARQEKMETTISANRKTLVDGFLPSVLKTPPARWEKYAPFDRDKVRRLLDRELSEAFGTVEDLLGGISLEVKFKGVTYEMLLDPKFKEAVLKRLPDIDNTLDEHEALRVRQEREHQEGMLFPDA